MGYFDDSNGGGYGGGNNYDYYTGSTKYNPGAGSSPSNNGRRPGGGGPKITAKTVVLIIIAIIIVQAVISYIRDPQTFVNHALGYVVFIAFLLFMMRQLSLDVTRFVKFGSPARAGDKASKCPYCGSTQYSVNVVRTGYTKNPGNMTMGERVGEGFSRLLCKLTFGLSDRILWLLPGQHKGLQVGHETRAECWNCHGTWRMRSGNLW